MTRSATERPTRSAPAAPSARPSPRSNTPWRMTTPMTLSGVAPSAMLPAHAPDELMKRYGSLDEQAHAILFLASEESSYITGTVLPVGGGDQG